MGFSDNPPITVGELKAALADIPDDTLVYTVAWDSEWGTTYYRHLQKINRGYFRFGGTTADFAEDDE